MPAPSSTLAAVSGARRKGLTAARIAADLRQRLGAIQEAFIITIPPPPVRRIGNAGGFR